MHFPGTLLRLLVPTTLIANRYTLLGWSYVKLKLQLTLNTLDHILHTV